MMAHVYRRLGQKKLELAELARPQPGAGEVLVRICCAGINPVDWKAMDGIFEGWFPYHFPAIPGWDAAGVVEAVAPDVADWKQGDEVMVYGRGATVGRPGTYAEFGSFPADILAPKPGGLTWEQAAAIPLAALTAWQALVETAQLRPGQRVIIPAASGGVGSLAVQLAKHLGADVVASCSDSNRDYVTALGADRVLDYETELSELPRASAHCLLGTLPPAQLASYLPGLKPGGLIIPLAGGDDRSLPTAGDLSIRPVFAYADGAQLRKLAALYGSGALKPPAVTVFPFEKANAALDLSRSGHSRGKRILQIGP